MDPPPGMQGLNPRFSCSCCSMAIPEDEPMYMRSDKTFCSRACRSSCEYPPDSPNNSTAHLRRGGRRAAAAAPPALLTARRPVKTLSFSKLTELAGDESAEEEEMAPPAARDSTSNARVDRGVAFDWACKIVNAVVRALARGLRVLAHGQGLLIDGLTNLLFVPLAHAPRLTGGEPLCPLSPEGLPEDEEEASSDESLVLAPPQPRQAAGQRCRQIRKDTWGRDASEASTTCSFSSSDEDGSPQAPPLNGLGLYGLTRAPTAQLRSASER